MTHPLKIAAARDVRAAVHQMLVEIRLANAFASIDATVIRHRLETEYGLTRSLRQVQQHIAAVLAEPFDILSLAAELDATV